MILAKQYNSQVKALYDRLIAKGKSKMSALGAAWCICALVLSKTKHPTKQIMRKCVDSRDGIYGLRTERISHLWQPHEIMLSEQVK